MKFKKVIQHSIRKEFELKYSSNLSELESQINESTNDVFLNVNEITNCNWKDLSKLISFFDQFDFFSHTIYFTNVHWDFLIFLNSLKTFSAEQFAINNFYIPFASLKTGNIIEKLSSQINYFDYDNYCFKLDPIEINNEMYTPLISEQDFFAFTSEYSLYQFNVQFKTHKPTLVIDENKNVLYCNDKCLEYFNIEKIDYLKEIYKPYDSYLEFETVPVALKGNLLNYENNFPLTHKVVLSHNEKKEDFVLTINSFKYSPEKIYFTLVIEEAKDVYITGPTLKNRFTGEESDFFQLPNIYQFKQRCIVEFSRAKRLKHGTGLVLLEFQNLEEISNNLTKTQKTLFYQNISEKLHETIRLSDYMAEHSTNSYLFMFPHLVNEEGLNVSMKKCHDTLKNLTLNLSFLPNEKLEIKFNIGGVLVEFHDLPVGEVKNEFNEFVLAEAENCLNQSKEKGENYIYYRLLTPKIDD